MFLLAAGHYLPLRRRFLAQRLTIKRDIIRGGRLQEVSFAIRWFGGFFAVVTALMGVEATAAPIKLAVFSFEMIDSSIQGEIEGQNSDDLERLSMIEEELKRLLKTSGDYAIIETDAAAQAIQTAGYLHGCNGCEVKIAKDLGANQALIGWVQKVSNLILNLNVGIRDVENGRKIFAASVDIRGNTDESWRHGIRYLVKRRMFNDNSKIDRN
ncbi:MAG: DUF3280 domain-containing protein [Geminicoccaceae bacterium]